MSCVLTTQKTLHHNLSYRVPTAVPLGLNHIYQTPIRQYAFLPFQYLHHISLLIAYYAFDKAAQSLQRVRGPLVNEDHPSQEARRAYVYILREQLSLVQQPKR